jgi:serine/threonine protein kinase
VTIRQLVRGTVDWDDLEAIALELSDRADREVIRVSFLEADNWLSTPFVVDEKWFVKVLTPQNAFVHAVFTGARNLGAFTSGTMAFFERFDGPVEMATHELEATRRMREIGLNAPQPVDTFEHEGLGVVVLEYLPDFRTFNELSEREQIEYMPALFDSLSRMHDNGLAHGDLRAENVLIADGKLHFIDATSVSETSIDDAIGYDLACALAVLSPRVGTGLAVSAAGDCYETGALLQAREFLDMVSLRPDLDVDANRVKGEIEKAATVSS